MIYLRLFLTFMKIGLFSFGGGYAMIPLVQGEIGSTGWITSSEFADVIAISEMTPGPVAVNLATYVGYKAAGVLGGIVATAGVALPSVILVLIIAHYFYTFRSNPVNTMLFYGIRPVVTALIITAAVVVAQTALFNINIKPETLGMVFKKPLEVLNIKAVLIMLLAFLLLIKAKLNPILVLAASGVMGVILFYVI